MLGWARAQPWNVIVYFKLLVSQWTQTCGLSVLTVPFTFTVSVSPSPFLLFPGSLTYGFMASPFDHPSCLYDMLPGPLGVPIPRGYANVSKHVPALGRSDKRDSNLVMSKSRGTSLLLSWASIAIVTLCTLLVLLICPAGIGRRCSVSLPHIESNWDTKANWCYQPRGNHMYVSIRSSFSTQSPRSASEGRALPSGGGLLAAWSSSGKWSVAVVCTYSMRNLPCGLAYKRG